MEKDLFGSPLMKSGLCYLCFFSDFLIAETDYRLSERKYGLISAAVINTVLFSWVFVSSNALYVKL